MTDVADLEITRLRAKISREEQWIRRMAERYSPPAHCCPSCACPGYAERCDAQERREAWLEILERKATCSDDD